MPKKTYHDELDGDVELNPVLKLLNDLLGQEDHTERYHEDDDCCCVTVAQMSQEMFPYLYGKRDMMRESRSGKRLSACTYVTVVMRRSDVAWVKITSRYQEGIFQKCFRVDVKVTDKT